jgi:hypothetical protein
MMVVALGILPLAKLILHKSSVRKSMLASARLGELMVTVGWVARREEDHVVAVAKRHELQAPKPDHRGQ